jgi:hypothetical protein
MHSHRSRTLPVLLCLATLLAGLPANTRAATPSAIAAPVLKWRNGGCFASWCQTGWYSSPAVVDLDGDGSREVVWGSYDVVALSGADGALRWRAANGQRVWPGIAVADLTGDGSPEVVVGRGGDQLTVYSAAGATLWTRNPFGASRVEVRTLAVDDLEQDGTLEIVVGRANDGPTVGGTTERAIKQLSVYEPDGSVRPGWPARRNGEDGYGANMYNENVAVGDLDGDGLKEVIGPTDTHYITALDRNGNQLPVSPIYKGKVWSAVGVHVDQTADLRGYANCGAEHRPNFANSAPAIADVDGDGTSEVVVVGDVYNCGIGDPEGDMYHLPWILKRDRTRWSGAGFDWTTIPAAVAGSAPKSQDFDVIQSNATNAVVADLDGDGLQEILYPSYDGRLHAYGLDKREPGSWPYAVPGSGIRFAGEPAVVDLDNDGRAEVIFTSWPENGGGRVGQLHILDYQGNLMQAINLPAPLSGTWNGGLGAPTVANIDADADMEVVVGTVSSGVVAYDLPGTAAARCLWCTGRGSLRRTGVAAADSGFTLRAPTTAQAIRRDGSATFTISLGRAGEFSGDVTLTLGAVPTGITAQLSAATVTPPGTATLTVTDSGAGSAPAGTWYRIPVTASGGGKQRALEFLVLVGGTRVYLPVARR